MNTIETSYNERICRLLKEIEEESGISLRLIGNTRIDETSEIKSHQQKLKSLISYPASICVIHSQLVEHRPHFKDEIPGLRKMVDKIHQAGLIAGVSTHMNVVVKHCEEFAYGIDTYLYPLNKIGYVYPGFKGNDTLKDRLDLLEKIDKPIVFMKALAAGRLSPEEGLSFVFENMRDNDILSLGLGSKEEAQEIFAMTRPFIG